MYAFRIKTINSIAKGYSKSLKYKLIQQKVLLRTLTDIIEYLSENDLASLECLLTSNSGYNSVNMFKKDIHIYLAREGVFTNEYN